MLRIHSCPDAWNFDSQNGNSLFVFNRCVFDDKRLFDSHNLSRLRIVDRLATPDRLSVLFEVSAADFHLIRFTVQCGFDHAVGIASINFDLDDWCIGSAYFYLHYQRCTARARAPTSAAYFTEDGHLRHDWTLPDPVGPSRVCGEWTYEYDRIARTFSAQPPDGDAMVQLKRDLPQDIVLYPVVGVVHDPGPITVHFA